MDHDIRMVLCDLDGTLLYDTNTITDRTKAAICALRKQGILFGICSGRSAVALTDLIRHWGIEKDVDFILGFNGGMFWDPKTGRREEIYPLDVKAVDEAIAAFKGYSFAFAEYQGREMLCTRKNPITLQMARRNKIEFRQVGLKDLRRPALKFMAIGMPWTVSKWLKSSRTKHLHHIRCFRSGPFLIEVVHPQLSKLEGAKLAAKKYGLRMDQIMSFGNDNNDLEMLEGTYGVAMANALEEVKAVSKAVTSSNRKDGVAKYLEDHVITESESF